MRIFKGGKQWNGLVVVLLGFAAILGCFNSILQLSRFAFSISERFSQSDWAQITFWIVLLIVWSLVLGMILGIFVAKQWYAAGVKEGSMAPSD